MKKTISVLMMVLLAAMLMVSCNNNTNSPDQSAYKVGDKGPAGGYIFYDVDADNDTGNQDGLKSSDCGWRYLEAGASDLTTSNHTSDIGPFKFKWGKSETKSYDTWSGLGEGLGNTIKLSAQGSEFEAAYVVHLQDIYGNGNRDWFIPSKQELELMLKNLACNSTGGFTLNTNYWSSSENGNTVNAHRAKCTYSSSTFNVELETGARTDACRVRPIRRFK